MENDFRILKVCFVLQVSDVLEEIGSYDSSYGEEQKQQAFGVVSN